MFTEESLVPWFRKVIPLLEEYSIAGFPWYDTLHRYSEEVWNTGVSVMHNSYNNRKVDSFVELLMVTKCVLK